MDVRRSRAISCLRLGFDYGAHTNPLGRRTFYMSIRIASLSMSTDIDIYSGMLTVGFSTDFGQRDVSVLLTYTAPVLSYAKSDQSSRVCPRALRKWKRILSRARSGGAARKASDKANRTAYESWFVRSCSDPKNTDANSYLTAAQHPISYQNMSRSSGT